MAVTLFEDFELAGTDEGTGFDAAEADEGTFEAVRSLERDVVVVEAGHTDLVLCVRSELAQLAETVLSGQILRVRVVDLDGDAVGTCALHVSGDARGLKLASFGKLLVQLDGALLRTIGIIHTAMAEEV